MRNYIRNRIISILFFSLFAGAWLSYVYYGRLPFDENYDILNESQKISFVNNNFSSNSVNIGISGAQKNNAINNIVAIKPSLVITKTPVITKTENSIPKAGEEKDILLNVPFAAQAPLGNWEDPMQQNGCEEVSVIMAMAWINGKEKLVPEEVINEIRKISNYELEKYGGYMDTNAEDTVIRIFKGYYNYEKVEAIYDIDTEDIKKELYKGNLVIVPANGRILDNPNYTPPGPETHMLPIIGYDVAKKEFITNDGGTRQGKNFRYKEYLIEEAILDYPTGNHEPITEIIKAMIVVKK